MKRKLKFVHLLSVFLFACAFLFIPDLVSAKEVVLYTGDNSLHMCDPTNQEYPSHKNTTLWNTLCSSYHISEIDDGTRNINPPSINSHLRNFTFTYDYKIKFDDAYITSKSEIINEFYGITKPITVEWKDITTNEYEKISDQFILYKYNNDNSEFDVITKGEIDKSSSFSITDRGIYKLETKSNQGMVSEYLLYEPDFVDSKPTSIIYNSDTRTIKYTIEAITPAYFSEINNISFEIGETEITDINTTVKKELDMNYNYYYIIEVSSTIPVRLKYIDNKPALIYIGSQNYSVNITLDFLPPVVEGAIKYFPKDYQIDELLITSASDAIALGDNTVSHLKIKDNTEVDVVIMTSSDSEGRKCFKSSQGLYICDIGVLPENSFEYVITDSYGNETVVSVNDVTFVKASFTDQQIKDNLTFEIDGIRLNNIEEFNTLAHMCVFYSDSIDNHSCAIKNTELFVSPKQYYKGDLVVVVSDERGNIVSVNYENKLLTNGYNKDNFTFNNIQGDGKTQTDISLDLANLLDIACGDNQVCLKSANISLVYDENNKQLLTTGDKITDIKLPTYVDILNKGFSSGVTCAFEKCNKSIEVLVEYKVGSTNQTLSAYYSFEDKAPHIANNLQIKPNLKYHFKNFNPHSPTIKGELFGTDLQVLLADDSGKKYKGLLSSRYIEYVDRQGNSHKLNNEKYDYLLGKQEFGIYKLEVSVKILSEMVSPNEEIDVSDQNLYAKSFFIEVELADEVPPVVTLVGSSNMEVRQYDVFKDPDVVCKDESNICNVTKEYFLNGEKVDEIDTKVAGKYTIKYTATDGDNQKATIERTLNVVSANAMDVTSIIIIVVVILAFVGFVTAGILIQIKRNKEEDKE